MILRAYVLHRWVLDTVLLIFVGLAVGVLCSLFVCSVGPVVVGDVSVLVVTVVCWDVVVIHVVDWFCDVYFFFLVDAFVVVIGGISVLSRSWSRGKEMCGLVKWGVEIGEFVGVDGSIVRSVENVGGSPASIGDS